MNRKIKSWKTTSFGRSIMGNLHCNSRCSHLSSAASFVQNQRLAYNLPISLILMNSVTVETNSMEDENDAKEEGEKQNAEDINGRYQENSLK